VTRRNFTGTLAGADSDALYHHNSRYADMCDHLNPRIAVNMAHIFWRKSLELGEEEVFGAPGGIRTRVADSLLKLERPTYSRRRSP
jgi:hypothetical protein